MSAFAQDEKSTFALSGGREVVDTTKANEFVNQWLAAGGVIEGVKKVQLSNKSITADAALVFGEFLDRFSDTINVADISDIIAGRPEDEALESLRTITTHMTRFPLTELNLSDNALGAKGVEACRGLLSKKTLTALYLCNNGLSKEASELVAVILQEVSPALETFHFYNNMSGDGGAIALASIIACSPTLKDIRFSATRSMPAGCRAVATALAACHSLTKLDCSDNTFGEEAAGILAESIRNRSDLIILNLRDDALKAEGFMNMMEIWKGTNFACLVSLDLSGNDLDSECITAFTTWVESGALINLQHLWLDDNELGNEGAQTLAKAVSMLKDLVSLSCCTCEVMGNGANALAKAVAKRTHFQKLELNGNQISSDNVEKVSGLLMRCGKILGDMEDNDEDGDEDEIEEEEEEEQLGGDDDEADDLVAKIASTHL